MQNDQVFLKKLEISTLVLAEDDTTGIDVSFGKIQTSNT